MPESVLDSTLDVPFTFAARPTPLPCDLRPVWRLHILVLILDQCWGGRASLEQLHVLNWAIRSEETRTTFLQFLRGRRTPNETVVRYDPSLTRAIDFALGEQLVTRYGDEPLVGSESRGASPFRLLLTKKGRDLVAEIRSWKDCFAMEKDFLAGIGKKITQGQVEALFRWS